ncbi:MAG: hypothetical protein QOH31_5021, partial [Verrucomicrobiota bacterium]
DPEVAAIKKQAVMAIGAGDYRRAEELHRPCARRDRRSAGRDEGTALGSNKGTARYEEQAMT